MEVSKWVVDNWFTVLNAVGIVGGLIFTAISLRSETKTRKVSNLIALTANHREIWKEFVNQPQLSRVLEASSDVIKNPLTPQEQEFVNLIVLHVSSVYEALKDELLIKQAGLRRDVGEFFSLPIPQAVWKKTKAFQNEDFVAFVEKCLSK